MIRLYLFGVFLSIAGIQDWKRREIDVWIFWLFGAAAVCLGIREMLTAEDWISCWVSGLCGILVGGFLYVMNRMTRGVPGMGDVLFFMISGWILGFQRNMLLLMDSLLLCTFYGLVRWMCGMLQGKINMKKQPIAFLPFVMVAAILETAAVWIGG